MFIKLTAQNYMVNGQSQRKPKLNNIKNTRHARVFLCNNLFKNARRIRDMEKYTDELVSKMREIYKAVLRRIRKSGQTDEADVLFIHFYKTEIEQNTNYKEND